jgi:hypothetical protein
MSLHHYHLLLSDNGMNRPYPSNVYLDNFIHIRQSFCNKCRHLHCDHSYLVKDIPQKHSWCIMTSEILSRNNSDYFTKWDRTGSFLTKTLYDLPKAPFPFHGRQPSCQILRMNHRKPFPIDNRCRLVSSLPDGRTLFIRCCCCCFLLVLRGNIRETLDYLSRRCHFLHWWNRPFYT